ncbi:hypothetical protein, partial [Micromonospora sp. 4G55]|uniref:hypothetical protein n=1 Tax=Micromonospora sp. 4G55 TaxID=2806102 RepID=UPI001EE4DC59
MSESGDGPPAPMLGRHSGGGGYRRMIGAHRAPGPAGPGRGYLFTVALLAGTASRPHARPAQRRWRLPADDRGAPRPRTGRPRPRL